MVILHVLSVFSIQLHLTSKGSPLRVFQNKNFPLCCSRVLEYTQVDNLLFIFGLKTFA